MYSEPNARVCSCTALNLVILGLLGKERWKEKVGLTRRFTAQRELSTGLKARSTKNSLPKSPKHLKPVCVKRPTSQFSLMHHTRPS